MKSATVFLVALVVFTTLFLEISTGAVEWRASEDTSIVSADAVGNEKDSIVIEAITKLKDRLITAINTIGQTVNTKDRIKVAESVKERLNQDMEEARNAITQAIIITGTPGPKPGPKGEANVIIVNNWLKNLLAETISVQNEIKAAINSGWVNAIAKSLVKTSVAVAEAKVTWWGLVRILPEGKVRDGANREMQINFENADEIQAILKGLLSGTTAA